MKTILSTKILSLAQKERLLNAGVTVVSYDAIKISLDTFTLSAISQNLIFTSQNAVISLMRNLTENNPLDVAQYTCFCVGEKTASLLEANGFKVKEMAFNAEALAKIIVDSYKNESFVFLCGNLRRDELPFLLKQENISIEEIQVYTTQYNPKKFDRHFDGILFFSPSGVDSFTTCNHLGVSTVFCIGKTTAEAVQPYSNNIIIANKPSVENVLVQVVKRFNNRPLERT